MAVASTHVVEKRPVIASALPETSEPRTQTKLQLSLPGHDVAHHAIQLMQMRDPA